MKLDEKQIRLITKRWRARVCEEHPGFKEQLKGEVGSYYIGGSMIPLKNYRHEKFALAIVKGMSQTDAAIEAGYKKSRARFTASRLVTYGNIIDKIEELNEVAETAGIMSVIERKERLSELARGRLSDFVEVGEDGSIKKIDIKGGHSQAIQGITITEFAGDSNKKRATKVRLHDPVRPIAELNKMEHIYEERVPAGTTIVNTFMFILPNGQKVSPRQLREVQYIEGQAIEHIEAEEDKG